MNNIFDKIQESVDFIKSKINIEPTIGLILGSGLGVLGDEIEEATKINGGGERTLLIKLYFS